MSNFYKTRCCGDKVDIKTYDTFYPDYFCQKCGFRCEVTAVIDESVKQYQEDIEVGVEVSGKTEQIREFEDRWSSLYSTDYKSQDEVREDLIALLSEQKQDMLSTIKGLGCNPENDSLTIARILNELR